MDTLEQAPEKTSLTRRALAVVVLVAAAWIIVKIAIGIVTAVFWTVLAVAAAIAVLWALKTLLW